MSKMHKRLDWVVDGKRYDRVSSTKIHYGETSRFLWGTRCRTSYLSPRGQFFFVDEDDGTIELIDEEEMIDWLEDVNAPSAAYRVAGFKLQDG